MIVKKKWIDSNIKFKMYQMSSSVVKINNKEYKFYRVNQTNYFFSISLGSLTDHAASYGRIVIRIPIIDIKQGVTPQAKIYRNTEDFIFKTSLPNMASEIGDISTVKTSENGTTYFEFDVTREAITALSKKQEYGFTIVCQGEFLVLNPGEYSPDVAGLKIVGMGWILDSSGIASTIGYVDAGTSYVNIMVNELTRTSKIHIPGYHLSNRDFPLGIDFHFLGLFTDISTNPVGTSWTHSYLYFGYETEIDSDLDGEKEEVFIVRHPDWTGEVFQKVKIEQKQELTVYGTEVTYYSITSGSGIIKEGTQYTWIMKDNTRMKFTLIDSGIERKFMRIWQIVLPSQKSIRLYYRNASFNLLSAIGDLITFDYEIGYPGNYHISSINFLKENRKLKLEYSGRMSQYQVKYDLLTQIKLETGNKILKDLYIVYTDDMICKAILNNITKEKVTIERTFDREVTNIKKEITGGTLQETLSFQTNLRQLQITNQLGEKLVKNLDCYGFPSTMIDKTRKIKNLKFENVGSFDQDGQLRRGGEYPNTFGIARNMLENGAFSLPPGGTTPSNGWYMRDGSSITNISKGYLHEKSMSVKPTTITTLEREVTGNFLEVIEFSGYYQETSAYIAIGLTMTGYQGNTLITSQTESLSLSQGMWKKFEIRIGNSDLKINKVKLSFSLQSGMTYYFDSFSLGETANSIYSFVENGFFDHQLVGWSFPNKASTDVIETVTIPNVPSITKAIKLNPGLDKRLSQSCSGKGNQGDEYVFSCWVKGNFCTNDIIRIWTNFGTNIGIAYLSIDQYYSDWQHCMVALTTAKGYSGMSFYIHVECVNPVWITGMQMIKASYGTYYRYNEKGERDTAIDDTGSVQTISYNKKDQIEYEVEASGNVNRYFYHANGQVQKIINSDYFELEYEDQNSEDITIEKDKDGNIRQTKRSYNSFDFTTKEETQYETIEYQYFDSDPLLLKEQKTDGIITSYQYTDKNMIKDFVVSKDQSEAALQYVYNPSKGYQVEQISDPNQNIFSYEYDSNQRLTKLKIGQEVYLEYIYDQFLLKQMKYKEETLELFYDQRNMLQKVLKNGLLWKQCQYDFSQNLVGMKDNYTQIQYQYDVYDRMITEKAFGVSHEYIFDSRDNLQKKFSTLNGKLFDYHYNYTPDKIEYLEGYYLEMDKAFCNDYILPREQKGTYGLIGGSINGVIKHDNALNTEIYYLKKASDYFSLNLATVNSKRTLENSINKTYDAEKWKDEYQNQKIIHTWIKLEGNVDYPFLTVGVTNDVFSFKTFAGGSLLEVVYHNRGYGGVAFQKGKWQLYTIVGTNNSFTFYLDGEKVIEIPGTNLLGNFGFVNYNSPYQKPIQGDRNYQMSIGYIGVGTAETEEQILAIYRAGKPFYQEFKNEKEPDMLGVTYSKTNVIETFQLNGDYISNLGRIPSKTTGLSLPQFEFDYELNRYVYGSFSKKLNLYGYSNNILEYDVKTEDTGIIGVWANIKSMDASVMKDVRILLAFGAVNLFLNSNNQLNFRVLGTAYPICYVIPNQWNHYGLSWTNNTMEIYFNGSKMKTVNVSAMYIKGYSLQIGGGLFGTGLQAEATFTMLTYNRQYQNIMSIYNNRDTTHTNQFDLLGRPKHYTIIYDTIEVYQETYEYDRFPQKEISNRVVKTESTLDTKYYTYYSNGMIKTKEKGSEKVVYEYDYLGRITKESYQNGVVDEIKYTYDSNGNRMSKMIKTGNNLEEYIYVYSRVSPDLLIEIRTPLGTIKYDYEEQYGRPNRIGDHAITWDFGRVLRIGTTSFEYNVLGQRRSKTENNQKTTYQYEGKKLVSEILNGKTTYYRYDLQGNIIGFQYEGKEYYYKKDITQIITNILDETGSSIVEYWYDSFGNILKEESSNVTIQNANNIKYKGYYYDKTAKLYYCYTRYYNPSTGRFISIDDISYLNPKSINGLNLYVYCMNNPVMLVDEDGHLGILAILGLIWVSGVIIHAVTLTLGYAGSAIASIWDEEIRSDMNLINWNPFNSNEELVLKSNKVSFYKGSFVIRHNIPNASSAGVLGMIFLESTEVDPITVQHEWGHNIQELILGTPLYLLFVATPSLIYNMTGDYKKYNDPAAERMYYSKIWERTADWFGGVNRNNYDPFWKWSNFIPW